MQGSGRTLVAAGGTLALSGTTKQLNRELLNAGATTWTAGALQMSNGRFTNNGTFTANSGGTLQSYGTGGTNLFENNGTLTKQGAGTLSFTTSSTSVPFNNNGQVSIDSGATSWVSYSQTTVGAALSLQGGSVTASNGLPISQGTLRGFGAITGNVTNNGTLELGVGGAGTLTITGTYTQGASGVMNVEIGGTTQGTQFDRLTVSGAATLGGTLNIQLINGFQPTSAPPGGFAIVAHASRNGSFATVNGTSIGNGFSFAPNYSSSTQTVLNVQ